MRQIAISLTVLLEIYSVSFAQSPALPSESKTPPPASIEVYFSPQGGAAAAIVKEIIAAKTSILVQAYSFRYEPIAEALAAAKRRNVDVQVLLDKDKTLEDKDESVDALLRAGIPTRLDGAHPTAHNKTMIYDGKVVITGSFNFTKRAEKENAENLLVIRDKTLAEKYAANWKLHAEHSKLFKGVRQNKPVE
jgi:phosphatidylserine/phosphatidylglycerophosphate/cardiolipin synthase-like enzyme